MPMYNLMECNDNHSKKLGSLWKYYRDEPYNQIVKSKLFEYKIKIIGNTPNNDN